MKKFKSIKIDAIDIENIFCNMCGLEIAKDKFGNYSSYFDSTFRWNYPSKFDNEVHTFQLCEKCYEKLISEFKLPPDIEN